MRNNIILTLILISQLNLAQAQSIETYLNTGLRLVEVRQFNAAIENFNWVIRKAPRDTRGYLNRAQAYKQLNHLNLAILDYDQVIMLEPNNTFVIGDRGALKIKTGHYQEAAEDFNRAIALAPQNSWYYIMRAEAKYKALLANPSIKKPYSYREIISDYTQGINLNNNFAFAFRRRGTAFLDSLLSTNRVPDLVNLNAICKDWSNAGYLDDPEGYLKFEANCGDALPTLIAKHMLKVARYYQGINDYNQAIQFCNQVLQLEVDGTLIAKALTKRSENKLLNRDYRGAIQDFNQLLTLKPEDGVAIPIIYYKRGWVQAQERKWEAALTDFDKALELGYRPSWVYYQRGLVKFQLKDNEGACDDWTTSSKQGNQEAEKKLKEHCKSRIFRIRK